MKHLLFILLVLLFSSAFAENKYLYTIELSPGNLADIDPRQNIVLKEIEKKQKAILIGKNDSAWMDLDLDSCLGQEIVVVFRYKAEKKGEFSKKAWAGLRYAEGDVYCDGPVGKSVKLSVSDEWQTASCSMKFPAEMEEAMVVFSTADAGYLVTDIKVYCKKKETK